MQRELTKETVLRNSKGVLCVDYDMRKSQMQELYDELLDKSKEFASLIYIQKDLQRDL